MKKIAIIYSGGSSWGGIETYLELLFANADRAKVNLTLISLGSWPLTRKLPNAEYRVRTLDGGRFRVRTIFEIAKCLREDDIDLIVSQGTVANAYARAASVVSGVPSLVVMHSDPYFDYPNPVTRTIYNIVEHLTRFPTKRYIAVSEYLKKKLVASGNSAGKITVVYNGVSLDSKFQIPNSIFNKPQLVIGSIGRLHVVKNYAELIRACAELELKDWKLIIIGEGGERKSLEALARKLEIADKVQLIGNVDNIYSYFEQMDIYIQPSLSEGFGLTVAEAMLAGKPVIVSPYGSLPELVQDGETGIVMEGVNHNDIARAISELFSDEDKAQKLAKAGQKYARETFKVERWASGTESVLLKSPAEKD